VIDASGMEGDTLRAILEVFRKGCPAHDYSTGAIELLGSILRRALTCQRDADAPSACDNVKARVRARIERKPTSVSLRTLPRLT
jgi:hypothetical protein